MAQALLMPLTVTLEDIYHQTAQASATIPCAVHAPETRAQWERSMKGVKKTGEWPLDLVAIAMTQVGYHESTIDFMVDDTSMKRLDTSHIPTGVMRDFTDEQKGLK